MVRIGKMLALGAFAALTAFAPSASAHPRHPNWDRIEDRLDAPKTAATGARIVGPP